MKKLPGRLSPYACRTARRGRSCGVTFIELIGVLVVAIVIIAGALALYSEANTSSRTNQLVVAIGGLAGSVRALHANVGHYGGEPVPKRVVDLRPVLISANAIPPGMLITESAGKKGNKIGIRHAFGGEMQALGMGQVFTIVAQGLDEDICIRLATESTAKASSGMRGAFITRHKKERLRAAGKSASLVITAADSGIGPMVVEGRSPTTGGIFPFGSTTGDTSETSTATPISPAAADTACATSDDNQVGWVFQ